MTTQFFLGKWSTWVSMTTAGFPQSGSSGMPAVWLFQCLKDTCHGKHSCETQSQHPRGPREMYPQTWKCRGEQTWKSESWIKKTCLFQERHMGVYLFSVSWSCWAPRGLHVTHLKWQGNFPTESVNTHRNFFTVNSKSHAEKCYSIHSIWQWSSC